MLLGRQTGGVADDENDRIAPQEHLADIAVLVDGRPALRFVGCSRFSPLAGFRPHLLDVLEEEVEVPVVSGV